MGGADAADLDALLAAMARGETPPPDRLGRAIEADPATEALRRAGFPPNPSRRVAMFRETAQLCPRLPIQAAGYKVDARLSMEELWRFYLPLCEAVLDLAGRLPQERRALVGIAGPGASGKTVLAGLLCELLSRLRGTEDHCVVCPLDGFHYPNAYLETHSTEDGTGRSVALKAVKGAPESFHAAAFLEALQCLREQNETTWPRYDRRIHDPVPNATAVGPEDGIAVIEGNYLLLEREPWQEVAELLDLRLFVDAPEEELRRAMIARHVQGGRSRPDAERHYEEVDLPNARLIRDSAHRADLLLCRRAGRVTALRRPC
ncbi:MAG: nucleoside/nucleotide kinase family protein [Candidatus Brocadiia bacterium]